MVSATFKKGERVAKWERNMDNPQRALKQVGILLVAAAQESFTMQQHGGKPWSARAPVNVYGILADLDAGKEPPKRRFETRPALRDTGRLAASIAFRTIGTHTVEAGTNLPYASVHNFGGKIKSVKITARIQEDLAKYLKGRGKAHKTELSWLLNEQYTDTELTGKVEARPFLSITKELRSDVRAVVGVEIMEVR